MLVRDLPLRDIARALRRGKVRVVTGAFTVRLRIDCAPLVADFVRMYGPYRLGDDDCIEDARIRVAPPSMLRRWVAPVVLARSDGAALIEPVPRERAFTALESCLNWGVVAAGVSPIIMHAAVLERAGVAMLMPAPSGSGKSTLAAALAWRGWRLLSDEMAVFEFDDVRVHPNPRPVSLKNAAIDVIRRFEPSAVFSRVYRGTPKGDIAYMQPPESAIDRCLEPASPGVMVIPRWREGASTRLLALGPDEAFRWLVDSTINYASMLTHGFELLTTIVQSCRLHVLEYSVLEDAIRVMDEMVPSGTAS